LHNLTTVGGDLDIFDNTCLSQTLADDFAASIDVAGDVNVWSNGDYYPCD